MNCDNLETSAFKRFLNENGIENEVRHIVFINDVEFKELGHVETLNKEIEFVYKDDTNTLYIVSNGCSTVKLDIDCDYMFAFMTNLEDIKTIEVIIDVEDVEFITEMFSNCNSLKDLSFIKNLYPVMNKTYNKSSNKLGLLTGCDSLSAEQIEKYYLVNDLEFLNYTKDGRVIVQIDKYSLNRYISFRDLNKTVETVNFVYEEVSEQSCNPDNVGEIEDIFVKCWHDTDKKILNIAPVSSKMMLSRANNITEIFMYFENLKTITGVKNIIGLEECLLDGIKLS